MVLVLTNSWEYLTKKFEQYDIHWQLPTNQGLSTSADSLTPPRLLGFADGVWYSGVLLCSDDSDLQCLVCSL